MSIVWTLLDPVDGVVDDGSCGGSCGGSGGGSYGVLNSDINAAACKIRGDIPRSDQPARISAGTCRYFEETQGSPAPPPPSPSLSV